MAFADHFSTAANQYAAFRPRYPQALVDALRARTTGDIAWDIGCGSGQLTLGLAEQFTRVIATDPAAAQIAAAPAHPRVEYRVAPAEASGLPDASVDLAVAAQAAHWFDWPKFVVEVGRVARPGALIALVAYGNPTIGGARDPDLVEYHDVTVGPYWPAGREHVENGYRDLHLPWPAVPPEDKIEPIAMTVSWTCDQLIGYLSSWSATTKMIAANGPAAYQALCARLAAKWPAGMQLAVEWPLVIKLARR
jgi:SAM-dependent methyltransferase